MNKRLIAKATISINASSSKVWEALTNPEIIKKYMFGSTVISDWKEGSQIIWKGQWQGKLYEDKGKVITFQPEKLLVVTHYSPLAGVPDLPENYHTVRYELSSEGEKTTLTLSQNNNATEEEKTHSEANWNMVLESLKKLLEE